MRTEGSSSQTRGNAVLVGPQDCIIEVIAFCNISEGVVDGRHRLTLCAPHKCDDLVTGADITRLEFSVCNTSSDTILVRPQNCLEEVVILVHISEGVVVGVHSRLTSSAVQECNNFRTGSLYARAEFMILQAIGNSVLISPQDALEEVVLTLDIQEGIHRCLLSLLIHKDQTGERIAHIDPHDVVIVDIAHIAQIGNGTGDGIQGQQLIEAAIAGEQMVYDTSQFVEEQLMVMLVGTVNGQALEGNNIGGDTGLQIQSSVSIVEGIVVVNSAVIAHSHAHNRVMGGDLMQVGQCAIGGIHQVNAAASRHLSAPFAQAVNGAQSQQMTIGGIVGQITDHEAIVFCHIAFLRNAHGGHVISNQLLHIEGGQHGTLVGLGVQHEQVVFLVHTVDRIAHHSQSSGSGSILALGQVGNNAAVRTADGCPAAIGHIVGQEACVRIQDGHLTVNGLDDIAIGGSNCDGSSTLCDAGDDTVLVNSSHSLIGRLEGDLSIQVHGQGADIDGGAAANEGQGLGGSHQQLMELGILLGILVADDVQAGDLCTQRTDSIDDVGCAGSGIHNCQTAGHGVLVQGSPVQVIGVIVIGHGTDGIEDQAGIADPLDLASGRIDQIQLCVEGLNGSPEIPGIADSHTVLHSVQAFGASSQGHEELLSLQDQAQLTGLHVDRVQVGGLGAGTCHTVHGRSVVVVGHVVDEGEAFTHVDHLQDLVGIGIQDHELEVCLPIIRVVAVDIQLAIVVLFRIDGVVATDRGVGIHDRIGISRICNGDLDPVHTAVGSDIGHDVAEDIVSGIGSGDGEGHFRLCLGNSIVHGQGDGSHALGLGNQNTILDSHDGIIAGGHSVGVAVGVQGQDVDVGQLLSADHHEHIIRSDAFHSHRSQLGDLSRDGVHTQPLDHAGAGGITQRNSIGLLVVEIHPVDHGILGVGPQDHIVGVIVAHGLLVLQVTQTLHQDLVLQIDHGLAGHPVNILHQGQLTQVAISGDGVEIALQVAGQQIHGVVIVHSHIHQLTSVHISVSQSCQTHVIDINSVHQTGAVVISHVAGVDAGGSADGLDITGLHIQLVHLAALGVAVEAAVVTVVVTGEEVHGRHANGFQGAGSKVHIDEVAVAVAAVIVVCVEVAVGIHDGNENLSRQIAVGHGDQSVALSQTVNRAGLVHIGNSLVGGGPGQTIQLIIPGQGVSLHSGSAAQAQDHTVILHQDGLQGVRSGDLVLGLVQSQQANHLGIGEVPAAQFGINGCQIIHGPGIIVGRINDDQIRAGAGIVVAGEVGPVDDTVSEGHRLGVVGHQGLTVGIGEGDLLTGCVGHLGHSIAIVLVQLVQQAGAVGRLVKLDGIDGAVISNC